MTYKLGPREAEILRAALDGQWFLVERHPTTHYGHCVKLFQRGYLKRDFPEIFRFAITDEGRLAILLYERGEAA